ncbi:protein import receptor MAS20 [Trichodelitschia bisporula]|uniref:Mitochondrial import receptor subunit TOM20 n=1 Tax=Trichodelitschia bisporula TaxID=703511 RepID=A0A6G1HL19_9PEZI|nr:protein import receptor MAS20 [Trichodelitschia bisporula]
MASNIKTSTIIAASVGTVAVGIVAYALYFDHRRRNDPEFRKALKRETRKQAKAAKAEAEAASAEQRKAIREAVEKVNAEGFPTDSEDVERFFMEEVAKGEALCLSESEQLEAALCFFRALKVYPQPDELITIYDKTVPKPILDILAEMVALDPRLPLRNAGKPRFDGEI